MGLDGDTPISPAAQASYAPIAQELKKCIHLNSIWSQQYLETLKLHRECINVNCKLEIDTLGGEIKIDVGIIEELFPPGIVKTSDGLRRNQNYYIICTENKVVIL